MPGAFVNRTEFISTTMKACTCCAASALVPAEACQAAAASGAAGDATADRRSVEFAHQWIGRFMDIMDSRLDEDTRTKLMEENGRRCHIALNGDFDPATPKPDLDQWIEERRKKTGADSIRREGNDIIFTYVRNDGESFSPSRTCLCPLVESGVRNLSPTYCRCSAGYVRELFRRIVRGPLEVELLSSVHRGDDCCRFRVRITS
jgi:hypothetical protein